MVFVGVLGNVLGNICGGVPEILMEFQEGGWRTTGHFTSWGRDPTGWELGWKATKIKFKNGVDAKGSACQDSELAKPRPDTQGRAESVHAKDLRGGRACVRAFLKDNEERGPAFGL